MDLEPQRQSAPHPRLSARAEIESPETLPGNSPSDTAGKAPWGGGLEVESSVPAGHGRSRRWSQYRCWDSAPPSSLRRASGARRTADSSCMSARTAPTSRSTLLRCGASSQHGPALDPLVHPLQQIGRPDLRPMYPWKGAECRHLCLASENRNCPIPNPPGLGLGLDRAQIAGATCRETCCRSGPDRHGPHRGPTWPRVPVRGQRRDQDRKGAGTTVPPVNLPARRPRCGTSTH